MFGTDVEIIEPSIDPLQSPSRRRKKHPWIVILAVLMLVLCGVGAWQLRNAFASNNAPTVMATATELGAGFPNPNLSPVPVNYEATHIAGTAESLFGALNSSATIGPTFTPSATAIFLKSNTPTDIFTGTPGATQTPRIVTIKVKGDTLIMYITTTPPPSPTRYPTYTPWVVITILPGPVVTREVTREITREVTREITRIFTPTNTTTGTPMPSETPTETPMPSETPTETPTPSGTPTETPTPSETPTGTPTPCETPTETPTPSETPTETPTP